VVPIAPARRAYRRSGDRLHEVRRTDDGKVYLGTKRLGLGRKVPPKEDPRDYPYRKPKMATVAMVEGVNSKYWWDGTWQGDQGGTSQCVAYSALHRIENSPRTYPAAGVIADPTTVYRRAQQLDEWPGEAYDGTSCRAGAKVMKELGLISEFRRAQSMTDFLAGLAVEGPWVIGTYWYWSMFEPRWQRDAMGTYRWTVVVDPNEGGIAGGHAYLINGVNYAARVVRILNSWGEVWGVDGRAAMSFDTLERLVFAEAGEAYMFKEVA
jgi:hypothetical protein